MKAAVFYGEKGQRRSIVNKVIYYSITGTE